MQEELLAQHTGRTTEQVRRDTARDLILTPEAAVDYGIVDTVLSARLPTASALPA
jgi:ATP-dependent Clp protease protease subunit